MQRFSYILVAVALITGAAQAQDDVKAEITVTNFRNEALSLKYEYVISKYSWAIMNYTLEANGEVTYRRPADLPGCNQLRDWGIDKGRFTISNASGNLCSEPLSICDMTNFNIEVRPIGCDWQEAK